MKLIYNVFLLSFWLQIYQDLRTNFPPTIKKPMKHKYKGYNNLLRWMILKRSEFNNMKLKYINNNNRYIVAKNNIKVIYFVKIIEK